MKILYFTFDLKQVVLKIIVLNAYNNYMSILYNSYNKLYLYSILYLIDINQILNTANINTVKSTPKIPPTTTSETE